MILRPMLSCFSIHAFLQMLVCWIPDCFTVTFDLNICLNPNFGMVNNYLASTRALYSKETHCVLHRELGKS